MGGGVMRGVDGLNELEAMVGHEVGTSEWFDIDQEMVTNFSELTGDFQWIHLDAKRANRELPFGGTIVQGFFTLSLIPMFRNQILDIRGVSRLINYGVNRVRFPEVVQIPSRVRGVQTIVSATRQESNTLRVQSSFLIEIEDKVKPACVAETVTLVYA